MNEKPATEQAPLAGNGRAGLSEPERRELIGQVLAEYGVKVDMHDPSMIVVDMCARVLNARLAEAGARSPGPATSGLLLAEAVTNAYATQVLPRLQAAVQVEFAKAVEKLRPAPVWTHPAFIAVSAGLAGVIVGFLLRRLV